jgi:hypothetical protein
VLLIDYDARRWRASLAGVSRGDRGGKAAGRLIGEGYRKGGRLLCTEGRKAEISTATAPSTLAFLPAYAMPFYGVGV